MLREKAAIFKLNEQEKARARVATVREEKKR